MKKAEKFRTITGESITNASYDSIKDKVYIEADNLKMCIKAFRPSIAGQNKDGKAILDGLEIVYHLKETKTMKEKYYDLEVYDEYGKQIDTITVTKEHYDDFVKNLKKQPITDGNLSISHRHKIEDLLKCQICGIPFKKIDEHTYANVCNCYGKEIRMSVGNGNL